MAKKTWREKYQTTSESKVEVNEKAYADVPAGAILLISTPAEVEAEVRKLKSAEFLDIKELRSRLAKKHKAEYTCPITTGIFLRIASEVNLEDLAAGKPLKNIMPFWRVISPKSPLAKKLPCGPEFIVKQRQTEYTKSK